MKLIPFIILIIVLYYIATQIKIVHIDHLKVNEEFRQELNTRSKLRSMLTYSHLKCPDTKTAKMAPPPISKLLELIKAEYLDSQYKFNISTLPVTVKYPNHYTQSDEARYVNSIMAHIISWNDVLKKYYNIDDTLIHIQDIYITYIMATAKEAIVKAMVKLEYGRDTIQLQLTYYCVILKTDDFEMPDEYVLQLTEMDKVFRYNFSGSVKPIGYEFD